MPCPQRREDKYSSITGVIFLFNLIVGTGALALPGAIQKAGYLAGVVLICVLALFSYITVSFVVESLAAANAVVKSANCEAAETQADENSECIEETPLVGRQESQETNIFEITEKYEIGQMSVLMAPRWCQVFTYLSLCIYLFGDLAIYAVVIGRTCSNIICTHNYNSSSSFTLSKDAPCWMSYSISTLGAYRMSVLVFILLMGPFVFFDLQKTRLLQIFTSLMRWAAFFIMLIWSISRLTQKGKKGNPPVIDFSEMPTLFGTLVYSFMCQHSIPGLLQPIKTKNKLKAIIGLDYGLVSIFYLLLSLTAIFAFEKLQDIYTLNFWDLCSGNNSNGLLKYLAYYLALFPVFTLSTNFPIIGITLRNNLRSMIVGDSPHCWYYDKFLFPLVTILPPALLSLTVSDVHLLVGVIGSYAGASVQYLIPCLLVIYARSATAGLNCVNIHSSPFKSRCWIHAVYLWMGLSLILITINYLSNL